jgi:hypothetical protein
VLPIFLFDLLVAGRDAWSSTVVCTSAPSHDCRLYPKLAHHHRTLSSRPPPPLLLCFACIAWPSRGQGWQNTWIYGRATFFDSSSVWGDPFSGIIWEAYLPKPFNVLSFGRASGRAGGEAPLEPTKGALNITSLALTYVQSVVAYVFTRLSVLT